ARSLNCGIEKSRRREAGAGGRKRQTVANASCLLLLPPAPILSIRNPQYILALLYLLVLITLGALYFYRDYRTFDAHLARAADAKLHNKRARAIDEYRSALRLKDDPHTHKLLGLELAAEENYAEALAELRAAEQGGEPDALLPYQLATTLDALGRTDEAVAAYRKFLQSELCAQPLPDLRCVESRLRARQ
ncbi:MAG: hypothetical protein M3371_05940, partial [Acidobacteriota bacterium]|nr:hypothetical protein [Acidobacteriota bacterium]